MTHKRQLIRHAIAAQLGKAEALHGRVFTTRARPTEARELPVVIVYALEENAERMEIMGSLQRMLTVAVEVRAASTGALDDVLDGLCAAIEMQVAADRKLGGLTIDAVLGSTTGVSLSQLSHTMALQDLRRISFLPTDVFNQTPGPQAGTRLRKGGLL